MSEADCMGTPEQAADELAALAEQWRDLRQPMMAEAKVHKQRDAQEAECRFRLANAALLWLWHRENPRTPAAPSADEVERVAKDVLTLRVTCGATGLIYVVCDQVRGLLVAERSLAEALSAATIAVVQLADAGDDAARAALSALRGGK